MTLDKFTIKAQEAVQQAVNRAQLGGQQVIEPVHLLKGVLEKAKDVCTFLFQKLSVNVQQIELLVDQELKHLLSASQSGSRSDLRTADRAARCSESQRVRCLAASYYLRSESGYEIVSGSGRINSADAECRHV